MNKSIYPPSKPDISPDSADGWRNSMKNLILSAIAALSLSVAVVPAFAATVAGDSTATLFQQQGTYVGGGN
jgi:hypothetical protein